MVTHTELNGNIEVVANGPLDLTGLLSLVPVSLTENAYRTNEVEFVGALPSSMTQYGVSGANFDGLISGDFSNTTLYETPFGTGDPFGIILGGLIHVSDTYVSNAPILGTASYQG